MTSEHRDVGRMRDRAKFVDELRGRLKNWISKNCADDFKSTLSIPKPDSEIPVENTI